MRLLNRLITILICVIFLCDFTKTTVFALETEKTYDKEVLIVQSYQRDYKHTRDVEKGIVDFFNQSQYHIKIHYEFLDAKKDIGNYNTKILAEMMVKKYSNISLDGVILCDDDALSFHEKYGKLIWPKVNYIVATGINSLAPYKNLTGVNIIEELPDIQKTIKIALEQNSKQKIQKLNFIYDVTTTSLLMRNEIDNVTKKFYQQYQIQHITDKTPMELKDIVDNASENELFFFVLYSRDKNGNPYYYDEVPKLITQNSKNPIYALWEFYLGTGVIGGYVASSYLYGEDAARMIEKLWDGKIVSKVQYENGSHQKYMFDYNVLKRYEIKTLPNTVNIINKPESYFEKNKTLITLFSAVIAILIIIIVLLSFVLRQKQSIHLKNQEIFNLNENIIETQKNLIERLGDVIETRSHETASHVKRVSEISKFLALKYGLSEQEASILETISPMHDIGKIGISENILHKPGKLTEKEFEIMKYHTNIGYEILRSSEKEMLYHASIVALEHHERWDGNGYPNGKSGYTIHIFARITAIADVYDAIRSDRVYKKAWPVEKSKELIEKEKGYFFEPRLADIFLQNIDEIENIRNFINESETMEINRIFDYLQALSDRLGNFS
ncbi:MAG: HD domain-containing phosphohydrolase [Aminipila sp.]